MFNATAVNIYGSSLTATSISVLAGAVSTPTPKEGGKFCDDTCYCNMSPSVIQLVK